MVSGANSAVTLPAKGGDTQFVNTAASYDDVVGFFKQYYAPGNASLVVAGDIDLVRLEGAVAPHFGASSGAELDEDFTGV